MKQGALQLENEVCDGNGYLILCKNIDALSIKILFSHRTLIYFYLQEESNEDDWSFLTESDLISIFDQFPLTELLKSTLSVKKDSQGKFFFLFCCFDSKRYC